MDGVMFMHSRRLERMREALDDEESVGEIKRIATQFTFSGHEEFFRSNIRLHSQLEPLGCLGDLGWYNIRIILWALKWKMPNQVTGRILAAAGRKDSPDSVNTDFSAELFYDQGVSASFYCSFLAENQQWAYISGLRGYLHVADFVLPFFGSESSFDVCSPFFRVEGCDFNMEPRTRRIVVNEYSNSTVDSQETFMFRNFSRQVLSKQLEESWPDIALKTQQVMDACIASARAKGQAIGL
jgi:predicted dehydrogenase